jgi:hypothetical protein
MEKWWSIIPNKLNVVNWKGKITPTKKKKLKEYGPNFLKITHHKLRLKGKIEKQ